MRFPWRQVTHKQRAVTDYRRHRRQWENLQHEYYTALRNYVEKGGELEGIGDKFKPMDEALARAAQAVQRTGSTLTLVECMELMLPVPDTRQKGAWDKGMSGPPVLTLDKMHELRQQIRMERRERRDDRIAWVNPAVAVSGVMIGAVAAIVVFLT